MGVNEKLQELITLLTTSNSKLDAILAALGSPPTPPVHTIDDIYDLLTEIKLDTAGVVTNTADMLGALTGPEGTDELSPRDNLAWNIWHLRHGVVPRVWPPLTTIIDMQQQLFQIYQNFTSDYAVMQGRLTNIDNYLMYALSNLGLSIGMYSQNYTGFLQLQSQMIQKIQGAIGVPADAFNIPPVGYRDIIQLLSVINVMPVTPMQSGMVPASLCSDAYISTGMAFVPSVFDAWPETVWALFPDPPPSGLSFGSVFGIGVDQSELVNSAGNWNDWMLFVSSDAANFGLAGNVETQFTNRFPTNVWLSLDGNTDNLAVFVGGENSVRVYLCNDWTPGEPGGGSSSGGPWGPGGTGGDTSLTLTSELVNIEPRAFTKSTNQLVAVAEFFDGTNTITFPGNPPYTYDRDVIWIIDMYGWIIEALSVVSPAVVQIAWIKTDGSGGFTNISVPGTHTVTDHTTLFMFCNPQNDTEPTGQFTVRITPP